MPKLHERIRRLIPQTVKDRIPEAVKEKIRPPAWRDPINPVPEWAQENKKTKWTLGSPAETNRTVLCELDSKGHPLRSPMEIPGKTPGIVTAVGPDFLVFQPDGQPPNKEVGFRVSKTDLVPLLPEKERKWGRRLIEVGLHDLEVVRACR